MPLGNRPAYPGKRPPYKPDVPCYTQKLPDVNGPAAAKSRADRRAGDDARRSSPSATSCAARPTSRPCARSSTRSARQAQAGAGEGQVRTAIRKHLPDFLAIIGLLLVAAAVVDA